MIAIRRFVGLIVTVGAVTVLFFGGAGGCNGSSSNGGGGTTGGTGGGGGGTTANLALTVTGAGSGMITSSAGDIACDKEGGTCEADLSVGTEVTLTPEPDTGYFFNGWQGGACHGVAPCTLTLNTATSVGASFVPLTFDSNRALNGSDAKQVDGPDNIWTILSDGSLATPVTQLTTKFISNRFPFWSPDGTRLAYDSNRSLTIPLPEALPNDQTNVWVTNVVGGGDIALTHLANPHGHAENPQWSPDGTKLLYESSRSSDLNPAATASRANVFVVNSDGSGGDLALTHLAVTPNAFRPYWSPDGSKVVYESNRSLDSTDLTTSNGASNIWIVNSDGSGGDFAVTQNLSGSGESHSPQWSPDGTRLAFYSSMDPDNPSGPSISGRNLWVVNADGTGLAPLTRAPVGVSFNPYWSPDGVFIVFTSNMDLTDPFNNPPNTEPNVWIVRPDGAGLAPLTALSSASAAFPYWSPDGSLVLYDSRGVLDGSDVDASVGNLWKVNTDGTVRLPVTHHTATGIRESDPVNFD